MLAGHILPKLSRSDSFSGASTGSTLDVTRCPCKSFGIQVRPGTATSWTVVVEGSLDGVNFDTIITHADTNPGSNKTLWSGAVNYPCLYYRARAVATNGNLTAIIIGLP